MTLNLEPTKRFNRELRAFLDKVEQEVYTFIRLISLDLFTRFVVKTPVDIGRARGGWQMLLDVAPTQETNVLDPTGQAAIATGMLSLSGLTPDSALTHRIFISNPVFYIVYLDQGTSKQAPANFTDAALLETQTKFFAPNGINFGVT